MEIYFNLFLARVKLTKNLNDIVKFIKKHNNLEREKVKLLLNIARENNSTYHMLEIAKYSLNLSLNDKFIIGCNIARSGNAQEALEFLKAYGNDNESELNYILIKKICKDSNISCMITLITSMKDISDEYHETIMSLIIEKSPLDILFCFIQKNSQEFSERSLNLVIDRLNKDINPYCIWLFSYLFGYYKTDVLAGIITLTNNPKYLYLFLRDNSNLETELVQAILFKLIEVGSLEYMKACLYNCSNLTSSQEFQLSDKIKEIETKIYSNLESERITVFKVKEKGKRAYSA